MRVDTHWLMRFQAILDLAQALVLLLAGLLAVGVLLIVGNTIRLEILNQRGEIEIMELVGATASFIRRPFLYAGAWYGLLGGLSAWFLVTVAVLALQGPVSRLASLYRSEFPLAGLGLTPLLTILGGSMMLGLVGSWIAVNRHLRGVEPDDPNFCGFGARCRSAPPVTCCPPRSGAGELVMPPVWPPAGFDSWITGSNLFKRRQE